MLQHIFQPDLLGCWIVCLCTVPYNCGVCSLFSPRVWSFPRCRPFTPPQPVASLTAPRHLVPHAPSWTPNYRPRPMLMIDFETRCFVYSLPLPQCKFAKAAKGGLRSCSAVLCRFKAWLSYLFQCHWIFSGLTAKTVPNQKVIC